jgi:hypothetical protein
MKHNKTRTRGSLNKHIVQAKGEYEEAFWCYTRCVEHSKHIYKILFKVKTKEDKMKK